MKVFVGWKDYVNPNAQARNFYADNLTEHDFRQAFKNYNVLDFIYKINYGFLIIEPDEAAQDLIENCNETKFHGRWLKVRPARLENREQYRRRMKEHTSIRPPETATSWSSASRCSSDSRFTHRSRKRSNSYVSELRSISGSIMSSRAETYVQEDRGRSEDVTKHYYTYQYFRNRTPDPIYLRRSRTPPRFRRMLEEKLEKEKSGREDFAIKHSNVRIISVDSKPHKKSRAETFESALRDLFSD